MEPMTLGSAPSSPSSPGVNPNFLPGFLMGDSQPTPTTTSPGRNRNNSGSFTKMPVTPEPRSLRQRLFNGPIPEQYQSPHYSPLSEKAGPPKQSLFDSLDNRKNPAAEILSSTLVPYCEAGGFNESISRLNEDTINVTDTSRFSSNFNRLDRIDSNWVTVFGFPPSAMSLVLAQMSNCGIVAEKLLPQHGNWVHLKFSDSNEVARALAWNGKCINSCIMIGVHLYHHNKENKENNIASPLSFTSPIRARSLRQSFSASQQNLNNSVVMPQNVPQKSTGLVNKAIEYVFGW